MATSLTAQQVDSVLKRFDGEGLIAITIAGAFTLKKLARYVGLDENGALNFQFEDGREGIDFATNGATILAQPLKIEPSDLITIHLDQYIFCIALPRSSAEHEPGTRI